VAARLLGAAEILVGAFAVAVPGSGPALALAITYALFAAFLVALVRRDGPTASCGCLGDRDAPPSLLHAALDLAAAGAGLAVAARPLGPAAPFVGGLPLHGASFLAGTALLAYLAFLAVAFAPVQFWSYRRAA
jgi:hypothetical protein